MTVFVDTGYFLALMLPRDQWHRAARKHSAAAAMLVTSSQVIGETITTLQRRGHYSLALHFGNVRRSACSDRVPGRGTSEIGPGGIRPSPGDLVPARWTVSRFAIMRRSGITQAYTFDPGFATARFFVPTLSKC